MPRSVRAVTHAPRAAGSENRRYVVYALDGVRETGQSSAMGNVATIPASFLCVRTRDRIILGGVVSEPRGCPRTVLICVHGFGSTFSSRQPSLGPKPDAH
jgi:hypothetical protein